MAIHKQGISGGFRGRVGNVVGSSWKGIDVMKIRPASIANPKTDKQQTQRGRFGLMGRFIQANRKLIAIGYKPYAVQKTALNAAMSDNLATAITGEFPDFSINYNSVKLSKGDLPGLTQPVVSYTAPLTVNLSWFDNSSTEGAKAGNRLLVGLYDPAANKCLSFIAVAARSEGSVNLTVPAEWEGRQVEVFAFFINVETLGATVSTDLSDTCYAGSLLLEQA
jgi:hypothetical protein